MRTSVFYQQMAGAAPGNSSELALKGTGSTDMMPRAAHTALLPSALTLAAVGVIRGCRRLRFSTRPRCAISMTCLRMYMPWIPSASAPKPIALCPWSSEPRCVRTVCCSAYLARAASQGLRQHLPHVRLEEEAYEA